MSDVNKVPKKEAVADLEKNRSRGPEKELARILISLIEKDLVDAVYQNGRVAVQAKGDIFTAFVKIWSTKSEQEIKTMIPKMRKEIENIKYRESFKPPLKRGRLSEPLIETLRELSKINTFDVKPILASLSEEYGKIGQFNKELASKIIEYLSMLPELETRGSKTKISKALMEIKKLVEEEEIKTEEQERDIDRVIELFEKFSNQSASEVKRILSETRKRLEEK